MQIHCTVYIYVWLVNRRQTIPSIISVMLVKLTNAYHSSSTECAKIRIDRYRANVGPNNDQQLLIKILQWRDKPVVALDKNKTYVAELKFSTNVNKKTGIEWTNHDVIYIGEETINSSAVDCLYTFILAKYSGYNNLPKPVVVEDKPVIDDLPF
jgi:hypothetical protein